MNKRQFLGGAALAGALPALAAGPASSAQKGPALLTVTGAVGKPNRGPLDPARDVLMHKQKLGFDKAHAFDFASLLALPALEIRPTLEYDGRVHTLRGPRLVEVLAAAGAPTADAVKVALRAIDGYAAMLSLAEAKARKWIVATHMDGRPMALGGLGPLWALFDADRDPQAASRPLAERFGGCPWALYHIDVTL